MIFSQLLKDIRRQKLRTFLTLFGIFWGTVSIVLLMGFGDGLRRQMMKTWHGMAEKVGIIWGMRTSMPFEGLAKGRGISLKEEDAEYLQSNIRNIVMISPEYSSDSIEIKHGKNAFLSRISGVIPVFLEMRNTIPERGGRFINQLDVEKKRRVVFLGDELKQELFKEEEAVGKYVMIRNIPFLVIGVMIKKAQNSDYNGRDSTRAIIPISTYASTFGEKYLNNIIFKVRDDRLSKKVEDEIYRMLGRKYRFDPADKEALMIWDTSDYEDFFRYFFLGFEIFLGIVGSFTLIAGAINLSNIMSLIVEDRRKEIGIKMALGATRKYILTQYLTETMLLVITGGLLGFLLAYGVVSVFPMLELEEYIGNPIISMPIGLITIIILGAAGLWAGYPPAKRAAELNPVVAIKD